MLFFIFTQGRFSPSRSPTAPGRHRDRYPERLRSQQSVNPPWYPVILFHLSGGCILGKHDAVTLSYLDLGELVLKYAGFQQDRFSLLHAGAGQRQFVIHIAVAITNKQTFDCQVL